LLKTFLFPTHPPTHPPWCLTLSFCWSEIDEDSTLKWGLARLVKGLRLIHGGHWDRRNILQKISCGWEAPAKWRLNGPLVLHTMNDVYCI
jgi:hypothetical protein